MQHILASKMINQKFCEIGFLKKLESTLNYVKAIYYNLWQQITMEILFIKEEQANE